MKQKRKSRLHKSTPYYPTLPSYSIENTVLPENYLREFLLLLLQDLEFVEQSAKYHPEGNALYHSLQVFQLAYESCKDPQLWAVALLHDIGKAIDYPHHEHVGAELLSGILAPRIIWLIRHHLLLLSSAVKTRQRLKQTQQLEELEMLRRWDMGGRKIETSVLSPSYALDILLDFQQQITNPNSDPCYSQNIF